RPQPAAEGLGLPELVDLLHRLHEDVLAQFLGLGVVAQPPQRDREHMPFEPLEQFAESGPVAPLGGQNQLRHVSLVGVEQGESSHGKFPLKSKLKLRARAKWGIGGWLINPQTCGLADTRRPLQALRIAGDFRGPEFSRYGREFQAMAAKAREVL